MTPDTRSSSRVPRVAAIALVVGMLLAGAWTVAAPPARGAGLPAAEPKLLAPEEAFRFSARALDAHTLEVRFDIADGYYLYRDKLGFEADAALGTPALPEALRKHDAFFGEVLTYRGRLVVRVPVPSGVAGQSLALKAASQGCADAGVCYPPSLQQVKVALPAAGAGAGPLVEPERKKGWFN